MRVEIGPMRTGDARQVGTLHHRSWVDTYGDVLPRGFWRRWTRPAAIRRWQGLLADPTPRLTLRLVAREGQRVVGFAVRGPVLEKADVDVARPTELYALYVDTALHGSGVGQGLLDASLGEAEPAQLWVWSGNDRAIGFYARNGFVADGTGFVDARFPELDEIRMVR